MNHDEFEKRMKQLTCLITEVYQVEVETFYNISPQSSLAIHTAISNLKTARDHMGD